MRTARRIIVHWLGDVASKNYVGRAAVERVRSWHLAKGYWDIGYHYLIDRDGKEFSGREDRYAGAHAGPDANRDSIGVCFMFGSVDRSLTKAAKEAAGKLFRELAAFYRFELVRGDTVIGHKEVEDPYYAATACPGFILKELNEIIDIANGKAAVMPAEPAAEVPSKTLKLFLNPAKPNRPTVIEDGKKLRHLELKTFVNDNGIGLVVNGRKVTPKWARYELGYEIPEES